MKKKKKPQLHDEYAFPSRILIQYKFDLEN